MNKPWYCYVLVSIPDRFTYVGATVNVDRRLRQHNGELCGGAKYTKRSQWVRHLHVEGFPNQSAALSFEWRWKKISTKQTGSPLEKRIKALKLLMELDKPTSKAIPYSEYPTPLKIVNNFKNYDVL